MPEGSIRARGESDATMTPLRTVLPTSSETTGPLLRELVAHLRQTRTQLREEWVQRITEARLLTAMTRGEIFAEATAVFDNYVAALATGEVDALPAHAPELFWRILPHVVETDEL